MSFNHSATNAADTAQNHGILEPVTEGNCGQPGNCNEGDIDPQAVDNDSPPDAIESDDGAFSEECDSSLPDIFEWAEEEGPVIVYYGEEASLAGALLSQGMSLAEIVRTLKEQEKPITNVGLLTSEIIRKILGRMDDWPKSVAGTLFVDDPEHGIAYFKRHPVDSFFGWLRSKQRVDWKSSAAAKGEVVAELERTVERFDAVELLPHEPLIGGIYYRGRAPQPGDGQKLQQLVNRFCPDTTVDTDLIKAAFMTPMWGGPAGKRPILAVTSDAGRGAGKSTLVEMISHLYGGHIDVSAGGDIEKLKTRMLTPSARTIRIALIDNVKSMKLSWAELEAMVTAPVISGHDMYIGEGQRPNLITWFVTVNGAAMATDLAQRSVIIKLAMADYSSTWFNDTRQFIDTHRDEIIGDIIAALRAEPFPLAKHSRWGDWEAGILSRLPEPNDALALILERQGEANVDLEESEIIEDYFARELGRLGYDPTTVQVRIPVSTAADWLKRATGDGHKMSTNAASRKLRQMIGESQIKRLSADKGRTHGRGFIWEGERADPFDSEIQNDLDDKIEAYRENRHGDWRR